MNTILILGLIVGALIYLITQLKNKVQLQQLYVILIKRGLTFNQFMYLYILLYIAVVASAVFFIVNYV